MASCNMVVWNACSLNMRARRSAVRELVVSERVSLVCLQETKLADVPRSLILDMLGVDFDYLFLPASVTRGGILVAWNKREWVLTNPLLKIFSLTVKVRSASNPT